MAVVIGHRGARALAAENTLEAIRAAAKCKADMVEVDVRLSKDGHLVLMHDETVDRTTNGKGKVEELFLAELQSEEVMGKGKMVPTLGEAAELTKELKLGMVVEMKEEGLEELVAKELGGSNAMVTSFYHSSLLEVKEISNLKTGIIISSLPVRPVELALWAGADALFPKRTNPRLFQEAHRCGIDVYPWTINSVDEASWLIRLGADGLVTDDPCLIRDVADQPVKDTSRSNCDYYPCHHFEGQDCTHCFCPLYPCRDTDLGKFVITKRGKRVWTCIDCRLVHRQNVAEYLSQHPEATASDLKSLAKS
ncbi:Glycerophosphoryl diester phosphodiesterase family protein [uncultured archaeon]|nr:Glycerophosphoryl diester phosphodiesterase family protein [uncultured archaeon]